MWRLEPRIQRHRRLEMSEKAATNTVEVFEEDDEFEEFEEGMIAF